MISRKIFETSPSAPREKKTAAQVLRECINSLRKSHPGFEFQYHKAFSRES
ncbi:MAG: hypothetical protein HY000_14410 [Planctomycetes bacterium]|nr:hypothetical protein [Planctomycetota bacterium]